MSAKLTLLSHCALEVGTNKVIAKIQNSYVDGTQFNRDVRVLSGFFSSMTSKKYALYYEDAYLFCVGLFALLHSGKEPWIAGNNKVGTAEKLLNQDCILVGEWHGQELQLPNSLNDSNVIELQPLDLRNSVVVIFTSGSTGRPKEIKKTLQQFQCEIETLEFYWGDKLKTSAVLGTVSHQHVYGLIFRVLWPLMAGRCFHSEKYMSPESLIKAVSKNEGCWVGSPAQLKRLDEYTPWTDLRKLTVIFSSGGVLPKQTSMQIYQFCGHKVLEVYGSSETGGIAWRSHIDNELWTPFVDLEIAVKGDDIAYLTSPYLASCEPYVLDDKIKLHTNGLFTLLGRIDRIVKVEDKRLSLDELELYLNAIDLVETSFALKLNDQRDKIAVTLVLTELGNQLFHEIGRPAFILKLRKLLLVAFEGVALPRKWLFINDIPLTSEGKVNQSLISHLMSLPTTYFPIILSCIQKNNHLVMRLKILPKIIYFEGHFPGQPVLPGVTQISWVEHFAKIFFPFKAQFVRMEVIKFKHLICPDSIITMKINWEESVGKLYFELSSSEGVHSSGRMVYQ